MKRTSKAKRHPLPPVRKGPPPPPAKRIAWSGHPIELPPCYAAIEPDDTIPPEKRVRDEAIGRTALMPKGMFMALEATIQRIMYCYQGALGDDVRCAEQAMHSAVAAGFIAALDHYRPQLEKVPELKAWFAKRLAGGDKGRESASKKKLHRDQLIRDKWAEMEAAGEKTTNETVAAAMGVGRSTVIRAFKTA